MCIQQQVDSMVVARGPQQGPTSCPTCWYMIHMHKVFLIYIFYMEKIGI